VEQTAPPETDDGSPVGMSYVLREEAQLTMVWSDQDLAEHQQSMQTRIAQIDGLSQSLDQLRSHIDTLWERFVTLTMERILSEQIREFLDEIAEEITGLSQQAVEADCEIDRLRARLRESRRVLEDKIALLEVLAHRTSTQNHINMMLARVEGLEAYLLGRKDVAPEVFDLHYKRHTTAPSDLLYLRIRLLTTRIATIAANRGKQLGDFNDELVALLTDAERLKTGLAALLIRIECMSELSRYWLAYLDIAGEKP
jgi:chromosome segregation ATPase